jgi:glycosyltransferase involved in cell wall biosynthesis
MLRRASFVVCGTETGKREIEHFYQVPGERIRILPLPAPQWALESPASHGDRICVKHRIPEEYLFYPAQFWPHKNHVGLLLAVRHLRDRHGLVLPVVLVGTDMGNQAYIQQTVNDLDLTRQVYFLGFVSREDLACLYRNACALVYPSFFGPDNLPPLEAFALGCPVIAADVSGARELLGDGALFVDPRRPEHIAEAIKLIHDDRTLRENLVQRGLARASKWTGREYIKGIFSILDAFEAIRRTWSNTEAYHNIS